MTKRFSWIILSALLCLGPGSGSTPASAQDNKVISEIVISGNVNINKDAIQSAIESKPGAAFDRLKMLQDRASIESMGFFSAVSAKDEDTPAGVKVVFEVVENPRITSIVISGNSVMTTDQIMETIRTRPGQVYNSNTLEQDVNSIRQLYRTKGYIAYVSTEAEIDPTTGVLTLPVIEMKVGKIKFTGLKKTKPWVLEREMKLKEGAVFNDFQLQKDVTKVYELDYLDVEKLEEPRREPSAQEGYIDIIIPVTEKKTGNVTLGLGYSSLQKVVGRVEIAEKNFQGKGLGLDALYEVSGAGHGASWEFGYFNPWLRKDHTSLSARVYSREIYRFSSSAFGGGNYITDEDYYERRTGGSVGFSKPLRENLRAFLTFRHESVETFVPETGSLPGDLLFVNQDGNVSSLAVKGLLDTRDFVLDPVRGSYLSLTYEPGYSKIKGADGNMFTKIEADLRTYISRGGPRTDLKKGRPTLAARLMASWSTGSLPFWEQFFLGGAERLRGYREDRFWGNRLLLTTVEYRVPLGSGLGGVLFADYGSAWGNDYRYVSSEFPQSTGFEGHLGYGAGIRVNTPLGNIRLDYGFGDEGSRTHFSIGQAF